MKEIVTLILTITCTQAFTQTPYLYFSQITPDNGLSHNKVNCILQDRRGFIWLGTEDGLNRYDGQHFTVFRNQFADTSTISGNIITDLLEDEDGVLWITTSDGGLSRYDYRLPAKKQFKQFKHIQNDTTTIPVNIINKVVEDKYGYLWLATSGAYVLRFNRKTERFETPVRKGTRSVASLCIDEKGILWVGKIGGSFLKINTATLQYEMDDRYNDLYAKLPHATITALYRDTADNIWFGSWDNVLYCYNAKTKKEEVYKKNGTAFSFPNDEVTSFAADNAGRIWMAGRYYGLTIYDKAQQKFFNYRYNPALDGSVADDQANCVYIDRTGMVWLGTNKGVSIYNPLHQPFVQTFLPKQNKDVTIYDFYKNNDDKLWIATSEGIFIKEDSSNDFELRKIFYKGKPLSVTCFFHDTDNAFYLGTNYSLFKYDVVKNKVSLLPNTESDTVMRRVIDSRIVSIMRDTIEKHPVLLVSPYGHYITYYDLIEQKWVNRTDSVKKIVTRFNLKDNLIRKFYRAGNGHIWLAEAKYGLGDWQQQQPPRVNHLCNNPISNESISNDNVYDILEDPAGNLWVSTYGGGLNYYNITLKKFTHIAESANLLEGIQTDSKNNVWMISNGHLHRYNPKTKSYNTFNLPDLEKKGGIHGYIFKDNKNNFYVAGLNYFIEFDPLEVKETTQQPKVYFTDFKIFNESYNDLLGKKNIELRYFQNFFSIEFSAPSFIGRPVQYSYMLEGLDKNWTDASSRNFVNYSNLPAGNYIFKVRTNNAKGNFSNTIASINISIIPPFWERWWFYILCATVISSTIYLFYRYRINALLKQQAIRNKIAQDLHDNMGSTLSSVSVYSQVAKIYSRQNKNDQLQQILEKIGETLGEMISEMSDMVWAITPKNDDINTIIQRMESYAKPLLQAKNISFNFNYDPSILSLHMQMDKRKNFFLIFKEAINNAVKYSNCKTIDVCVHLEHHKIELKVMDDGYGFDVNKILSDTPKSLSGNGLKNMQTRAKEMNAIFTVQSIPGNGTTIFLSFNIP